MVIAVLGAVAGTCTMMARRSLQGDTTRVVADSGYAKPADGKPAP
jgi:hypothetical protein